MKKIKPFIIMLVFTLSGTLVGYFLQSISLFTGIGLALGVGYGLILKGNSKA